MVRRHSRGFVDQLRSGRKVIASKSHMCPHQRTINELGLKLLKTCVNLFIFFFSAFSPGMESVRRLRKARSACRACASVSTTCCVGLCCGCGSGFPTWCRTSPAPASYRLFVLKLSSTTSKSVSASHNLLLVQVLRRSLRLEPRV